jgi:hypothetical protein
LVSGTVAADIDMSAFRCYSRARPQRRALSRVSPRQQNRPGIGDPVGWVGFSAPGSTGAFAALAAHVASQAFSRSAAHSSSLGSLAAGHHICAVGYTLVKRGCEVLRRVRKKICRFSKGRMLNTCVIIGSRCADGQERSPPDGNSQDRI